MAEFLLDALFSSGRNCIPSRRKDGNPTGKNAPDSPMLQGAGDRGIGIFGSSSCSSRNHQGRFLKHLRIWAMYHVEIACVIQERFHLCRHVHHIDRRCKNQTIRIAHRLNHRLNMCRMRTLLLMSLDAGIATTAKIVGFRLQKVFVIVHLSQSVQLLFDDLYRCVRIFLSRATIKNTNLPTLFPHTPLNSCEHVPDLRQFFLRICHPHLIRLLQTIRIFFISPHRDRSAGTN